MPFGKFWMEATSGVALELKTGVPTYQVEDDEGRAHLLIHLTIEEKDADRWCLSRPNHAGFDSVRWSRNRPAAAAELASQYLQERSISNQLTQTGSWIVRGGA